MTEDQAAAVADALLAGPWRPEPALTRAAHALGLLLPPAWLDRAVRRLVRSAPPTRPELIITLVGTPVERDTAAPSNWPPVAVADLPGLAALLDITLSELDWFCDARNLERSAPERVRHYRWQVVSRPTGVRLLAEPKPRLKEIQRRLLRHVLAPLPVHPAAHGCVPASSVRTALLPHAGRAVVIRADLRAFFASVGPARVAGLLRTAGYDPPVARAISGMCTTSPPGDVLSRSPANAVRPGRSLPIGAPSSPALANLVLFRLDRRLSALAARYGVRYTRYVDDLIFSGDRDLRTRGFLWQVARIVAAEGFTLAPAKTSVRGHGARQSALGAVVNDHPTLPRPERDRLRATVHNCLVRGVHTQTDDVPAFRARLAGRIAWAAALDPDFGARLRADYARITWA